MKHKTWKMNKSVCFMSIFDKIITKMINWIKIYRIFVQISDNLYTLSEIYTLINKAVKIKDSTY